MSSHYEPALTPRTGVPPSSESGAPRSSLYASPPFLRNQSVPATYREQYSLSLSLSLSLSFVLLPPPPPVGLHNLVMPSSSFS